MSTGLRIWVDFTRIRIRPSRKKPSPDPSLEQKNPDPDRIPSLRNNPDPTLQKNIDPDPTLEQHPDPTGSESGTLGRFPVNPGVLQ